MYICLKSSLIVEQMRLYLEDFLIDPSSKQKTVLSSPIKRKSYE